MELTVLGSGTLIAQRDRSCAGYAVRHENGVALLDCGPGCLLRLQQAGIAVTVISLILISHFHWDHVAELPAFLNSVWLQRENGACPLRLAGPVGLSAWLDRIMADDSDWLPDLNLECHELNGQPQTIGSLHILSGRNFHTENSLSFRVENIHGTSLFYSGDTDYQKSLVPLASEVDLAVVECSWTQQHRGNGHLDLQLASRFAAEARVRSLLLTHFYQEVDVQRIIPRVKREFSGSVLLAEDLRVYPIPRRTSLRT
jgi:ribonuclease BN (tRNA processing enzyme)